MAPRVKANSELGRLLQEKIGFPPPTMKRNSALAGMQALGRLPKMERNSTEAEYEQLLIARMRAGEVAWFEFEAITLVLAERTSYQPDFFVMLSSGQLEVHEVKGRWTDDARVKIKVAARLFPFRFIAVQKVPKKSGGGWKFEYFD